MGLRLGLLLALFAAGCNDWPSLSSSFAVADAGATTPADLTLLSPRDFAHGDRAIAVDVGLTDAPPPPPPDFSLQDLSVIDTAVVQPDLSTVDLAVPPDLTLRDFRIPPDFADAAPLVSCFDSVKNGGETDVDCGGPSCHGCMPASACRVNSDCRIPLCLSGKCAQAGALGKLSFAAPFASDVGASAPAAMVAARADFDGDGHPDVALKGPMGSLGVATNRNGRLFSAPQAPQKVPFDFSSMVVADVNGDGRLDVAVAGGDAMNGGSVGVALGNGDGTLRAPTVTAAGSGALPSIAAADFNGDGKADVAIIDEGGQVVDLLLSAGATLGLPVAYATGSAPRGLAVGDFNFDGNFDLVTVDNAGIGLLAGNGDGTFRAERTIMAVGFDHDEIAVGDWNGDGITDLAGVSRNGGLSIAFGDIMNTFIVATPIAIPGGADHLAVGDWNGDNKLDAAVVLSGGALLQILYGNGNGTFQSPAAHTVGQGAGPVLGADFTGDAFTDVAVVCGIDGTVVVWSGPSLPEIKFGAPAVGAPAAITSADVNRDGKLDVLYTTSAPHVSLGAGDGTFGAPSTLTGMSAGLTAVAGDVNQDGKLDFLVDTTGGFGFAVGLGHDDGTFGAPYNGSLLAPPLGLALSDMNGDGQADVLVLGQTQVGIYYGLGDGTFPAPLAQQISVGMSAAAIVAADFNGDGLIDFATTDNMAGRIRVLISNGAGFGAPLAFNTGTSPGDLRAADLDGDGKMDLVVAVTGDGTIHTYGGHGDGTFVGGAVLAAPGVRRVLVSDLDLDGRLDIVALTSVALVFLGDGTGMFASGLGWFAGPASSALEVGDLNGDGEADLIVPTATKTAVLLNNTR